MAVDYNLEINNNQLITGEESNILQCVCVTCAVLETVAFTKLEEMQA